ncbi:MAG: hypothetical protein LBQ98_03960, partial [Nitrososphaerota archaeon]|nr:hypothetical protein [Nitrososphaerota archaeon]
FGTSVTEYAIGIEGYNQVVPTSATIDIGVSGNVITFYYTPKYDLEYVVHYYLVDTSTSIAPDKAVTGQIMASQVTEHALNVAGYTALEPTSLTKILSATGNEFIFYYTANPDPGTIGSIRKTVDGIAFETWATGYGGSVAELVSGMAFTLYRVNVDGTINYDDVVANGALNANSGMITFDTPLLVAGQYAVVESFTGQAANIFEQIDPLYIWIGTDGKMAGVTDFDSDAMYWSTDNFYRNKGTADLTVTYTLASSTVMINPWFNDFQTREYNPTTGNYGTTYSSFCGYYGSGKLGGDTYNGPTYIYVDMTANFAALKPGVKADLISAFNYIYDTWGSLDQWPNAAGTSSATESTKFITQITVWLLLNDGITEAHSDFTYINNCIADVLANYKGYSGSQTITDLIFLADADYPNNLLYCQPQIIPIYGEPAIDNQLKPPQGSFSIAKTVDGLAFDAWVTGYGGSVAELVSGMAFTLYRVNADGTINYDDVVANGALTDNKIDFNTPALLAGRYAIVETLTGTAAEIFADTVPLYISISENGDIIEDFDYNANYFVSWNWFNSAGRVGLTDVPLGYYYIIEVWNIETRTSLNADYKAYTSFCADGTSRTFAETEPYVAGKLDQETYDKILAAFNYIYNKYGSVDAWQGNTGPITVAQSTKVLSQMAVWALIHNNDASLQNMRVAQDGYDADEFADALQDVLANSGDSSGAVKEIVYLVGSNFPGDIISCQPQIVPLFGDPVFNNSVLGGC